MMKKIFAYFAHFKVNFRFGSVLHQSVVEHPGYGTVMSNIQVLSATEAEALSAIHVEVILDSG